MNRGTQAKLREITNKLSDILEQDTDEQVMVFTDNKTLMDLCGQINLLLLDRQKIKADSESRKLLPRKCFQIFHMISRHHSLSFWGIWKLCD